MTSPFAFFNDGIRVEPRWPDGQVLTDTGIQVGGVSPKAIVEDENGFRWMLKFEGVEADTAACNMAAALHLPQPFVKRWNDSYMKRGTRVRAEGTIQEWLDSAVTVGSLVDMPDKISIQRSFHSIMDYLISDPDRHGGNEVVWYNDVYAIDRSRALGWAGHMGYARSVTLSSLIMSKVSPDMYEAYIDRLDRISDALWLDMAGMAGITFGKDVIGRKASLRSVIVDAAERHVERVVGEKRDDWDRFIRLNK